MLDLAYIFGSGILFSIIFFIPLYFSFKSKYKNNFSLIRFTSFFLVSALVNGSIYHYGNTFGIYSKDPSFSIITSLIIPLIISWVIAFLSFNKLTNKCICDNKTEKLNGKKNEEQVFCIENSTKLNNFSQQKHITFLNNKKIALQLITISLISIIIIAALWHAKHEKFIHKNFTGYTVTKVEIPAEIVANAHWDEYTYRPYAKNKFSGWALFDDSCIENSKSYGVVVSPTQYERCIKKFIPHIHTSNFETINTFVDFIEYYSVVLSISVFLLIFGILVYAGILNKYVIWIKDGKN